MPRTAQEILDHAEELAARFEHPAEATSFGAGQCSRRTVTAETGGGLAELELSDVLLRADDLGPQAFAFVGELSDAFMQRCLSATVLGAFEMVRARRHGSLPDSQPGSHHGCARRVRQIFAAAQFATSSARRWSPRRARLMS